MKLSIPYVEEITPDKYDLTSIYKHIERCGKVCYKSEGNITEDSYKAFIERITESRHGSVLEHGAVYLTVPMEIVTAACAESNWDVLRRNPYTKTDCDSNFYYYSTNMRVIVENGLDGVLEFLCEPTQYHSIRRTFKIVTDIGVTREANRHRKNSPSEMSTRYCNFSKEKYGNEITVIMPPEFKSISIIGEMKSWIGEYEPPTLQDFQKKVFSEMCLNVAEYHQEYDDFKAIDYWVFANLACEFAYMGLLKCGWKPQQARRVLPLDLKSELAVTAFEEDWRHFLSLRCAPDAHPDIQIVANEIKELL